MSLLWSQAVKHEAMPWVHRGNSPFKHPVIHSVRNAGFKGYADDKDQLAKWKEYQEENGPESTGFDEQIHEETVPEPTHEEEAHHAEHGEYPESFYERHDEAYEKAREHKKAREDIENEPDIHDPILNRFIRGYGSDTDTWRKHGEYKPIDLTGGVHATQSHVSQTHIDRYKNNPNDDSEHEILHGKNPEYLGHQAPMFVTHQGRLHATEGHHRVAAALQTGKKSMLGWHYDLDKDPADIKGWLHDDNWDDDQ